MKNTYEEQSSCCGAEVTELATDDYICHECKEHCEVVIIEDDGDDTPNAWEQNRIDMEADFYLNHKKD